ncbi:Permease of the drug/metabolite transporter (DMT) superfamily [Paenibacillus uliginis N3/975]|uniref:Permease of the drug/metabolite transporter (DMT) superfamily n=1 Tax=Paenibacillus uliginis N3/975 TaxID=1313296 RepID=A0A1X7HTU9_9BACL|nr:DMT family transporter [Paenibacillus uliginis]SMF92964.1 Permease of the drug/metabolite transporter (DMT) superfamily [Paenibacillus uliginis N3/975]
MLKKQIVIGSMLCLIASMSWGAMFPVAHIALQQIDPFYFSFIRYFVVAVILSVLLWVKEGRASFRMEGRGKTLLFFGTMAFTVYNMCIFLGQQLMGESGTVAASIMEVLMPMISIMVLWITTKKTPNKYTLTSVAIALTGALLVITNGELAFFRMAGQHLVPLFLIFVGVMGWVVYSMGGSRFKDWSILRYSTLTCLLGSAVSFVIVTLASVFHLLPVPTWHTILSIKYEMSFMILLPGLAALLCWNLGIKLLSPLNGILFINFVPITTFVIMALQGYQISNYELFGTLLIIFALIRNNAYQRKTTRVNHGRAYASVQEQ